MNVRVRPAPTGPVAALRLLVLALVLAGCAGQSDRAEGDRAETDRAETDRAGSDRAPGRDGSAPAIGGNLIVVVPPVRIALQPLQGDHPFQVKLWDCFYPRLFERTPQGARPPLVRPELAAWSRWQAPELLVGLRRDRVWEDTTRVSISDVVETFRAYQRAGLTRRWATESGTQDALVRVEASGDSAVRFVFRADVSEWVAREVVSAPVLPARWVEREAPADPAFADGAGDGGTARGLISAGPFRVPGEGARSTLSLRANPLAVPRPWVRRVLFEVCPGSDARILRVASGRADLATDVPVHQLAAYLDPRSGVDVRRGGVASVEALLFRDEPPAIPRRVRRTIAAAIDRGAIVQALLTWRRNVYGGPAVGWCDPTGRGAPTRWAPPPAAVDSTGAPDSPPADSALVERDLLPGDTAQAIRILYDRTNEFRERLLLLLEADLRRVGLRVEAVPVEGPEVIERWMAGEFEAALVGLRPPRSPDLSEWFASWGRWNGMGYSDAETDLWCRRVLASDDEEEIAWLVDRIEARVERDAVALPLVYREAADLLSPRVRGFQSDRADPFERLETVWLADTTDVAGRESRP